MDPLHSHSVNSNWTARRPVICWTVTKRQQGRVLCNFVQASALLCAAMGQCSLYLCVYIVFSVTGSSSPVPLATTPICVYIVFSVTGSMNSRYYTDLLVNEGEDSQDATAISGPTIQQTAAIAKSSQGRGANFSSAEDILLVSAWLNVGMDPILGVDQSQGTYWRRIHEYFHGNKTFESTRTEGSLMNRWSAIQHDVNVFCGCVSRIEARSQSGTRVDDKIADACALFKAEDKKQRKFSLMHCWNILKDKPKWMDKRKEIVTVKKPSNKKQKIVENSSPASNSPTDAPAAGDIAEASGRPDGKKKEKHKLRQRSTVEAVDYLMAKKKEADLEKDLKKEERCNKAFALQEERLKLEKQKFEFQMQQAEKEEEERILGLDLSTMNYKQQQYYEHRQNEILARRCNI